MLSCHFLQKDRKADAGREIVERARQGFWKHHLNFCVFCSLLRHHLFWRHKHLSVWFIIFSFVRRSWRVLSGGPATVSGAWTGTCVGCRGELYDFVLVWDSFVYGFWISLCVFRLCVPSSETWPLSILSLALPVNLLSLPGSNLKLRFFAPLRVGWTKWARWPYCSPLAV